MVYDALKAFLDPIPWILAILAIGIISSFRKRARPLQKFALMASFFTLYVMSISPIPNALCFWIEKDYLRPEATSSGRLDVVVVLGGGVSDNARLKQTLPSNQTASRLLHAIRVFRKSGADFLICAGRGTGQLSEAEVMGNAAESLGIPKDQLILDPISINTSEHAANMNLRFDDKSLKIGLVTSAYHMKRAEREFKKYFSSVEPLPSDFLWSSQRLSLLSFMPQSFKLYKLAVAVREIFGNVWYRIKK